MDSLLQLPVGGEVEHVPRRVEQGGVVRALELALKAPLRRGRRGRRWGSHVESPHCPGVPALLLVDLEVQVTRPRPPSRPRTRPCRDLRLLPVQEVLPDQTSSF